MQAKGSVIPCSFMGVGGGRQGVVCTHSLEASVGLTGETDQLRDWEG